VRILRICREFPSSCHQKPITEIILIDISSIHHRISISRDSLLVGLVEIRQKTIHLSILSNRTLMLEVAISHIALWKRLSGTSV
jgi:hypothetical protein